MSLNPGKFQLPLAQNRGALQGWDRLYKNLEEIQGLSSMGQ